MENRTSVENERSQIITDIMNLLSDPTDNNTEMAFELLLSIGDKTEAGLPEEIKKDLLDPTLFNSFSSNRVKINPELLEDWVIGYRTVDVYNGYITLTSNSKNVMIHRVPLVCFLNFLKNETYNSKPICLVGQNIIGSFIIGKTRKLYSKEFYEEWLKIHNPQEENDSTITKDNLVIGNYYKLFSKNINYIHLQKYLGFKYIINYATINNILVPKISKRRLAIEIFLASPNKLLHYSEFGNGYTKTLSNPKKLTFFKEFQELDFIDQVPPENYNDKIKKDLHYSERFITVLDELPKGFKKNPGFIIKKANYGDFANIIFYKGTYFLGKKMELTENAPRRLGINPNYIIKPDKSILGKFHVEYLWSNARMEKYPNLPSFIYFEADLSNAYYLDIIAVKKSSDFLNFEDGFQL